MKKKYPYRPPKLNTRKNDLDKKWYIEFYQWNFNLNKLVRKRWYQDFDKHKTLSERYEYGQRQCKELMLYLPYSYIGEDPDLEKTSPKEPKPKNEKVNSFQRLVDMVVHKLFVNHKGYAHYSSVANIWLKYVENQTNIPTVSTFSPEQAQKYIDYMYLKEKVSATTIHNRVSLLKSIYNKALKRGYVDFNPFLKLELPQKTESKKNLAYTSEMIAQIKKEASPFLWLCCQFIYYTYIRPIELTRLTVASVLLDDNKIKIEGGQAKNKKTAWVALPEPLKKQLIDYGIEKYSPTDYLFTSKGYPGPKAMGKNYLNMHHKKVTDKLKFSKDYTLYSWKHTGVVNAYKNGVDLKYIQMQCRHHSITQTDTYLKSLGFMDNDEFLAGIPEI